MVGQVTHQNYTSEEFPITNNLKQGCVLAPTLFSLYLTDMLHEIPPTNPDVGIKYRFNEGLYNLSRLSSQRLTNNTHVTELQYVDNMPHLLTHLKKCMNRSIISQMHMLNSALQLTRQKYLRSPQLSKPLEQVDLFPYLGSILSSNVHCMNNTRLPRQLLYSELNHHQKKTL
ncbi:uncharacterized protein LOC117105396 [Anneissia japonica]|uniref:uncharacterized protein LOC117105396 n=1 Tax=Anneissia japonica TaxID=1529436 RepID=UPI001425B0F9|nr:uncharacterized protein LOC117105396 [Anneissia japonica]